MFPNNVFERAERTHLQCAEGNLQRRKIGFLLIACNLFFVALPFLATDHYADITFHVIIGICLIIFCLGYELSIIALAINAIDHEKQNRTWESLVLTGVHSGQVVFGKWLALVQYNSGTALLLSISKLAIAYSVMQYLNIYPSWLDVETSFFNRPFVYMSYDNFASTVPIALYPRLWQIIFAFIVLGVLGFAEIGLLTSFGMLCAFIKIRWSAVKLGSAVFMGAGLALFGIVLVFLIGYWESSAWFAHKDPGYDTPSVYYGCEYESIAHDSIYYRWCLDERDHRRIFETAQVATSALADNGVLIAANIMRPIGSFQFAVRNVFSGLITLTVTMTLTIFGLFLASIFVQRHTD